MPPLDTKRDDGSYVDDDRYDRGGKMQYGGVSGQKLQQTSGDSFPDHVDGKHLVCYQKGSNKPLYSAEDLCGPKGSIEAFCHLPTCTSLAGMCHGTEFIDSCPGSEDDDGKSSPPLLSSDHKTVYCPFDGGNDETETVQCYNQPQCDIVSSPCPADNQTCSALQYICNSETDCGYSSIECVDGCWARTGDWECTCPLDYMNDQCKDRRPFTCQWSLVNPVPNCVPFEREIDNKLAAIPICFNNSVSSESIRFDFRLFCEFDNLTDIDTSTAPDSSFMYYVLKPNNTFAISYPPSAIGNDSTTADNSTIILQSIFRVFNFDRWSDLNTSIIQTLYPDQLLSERDVSFTINISAIYQNESTRSFYFPGGRMFVEVDLWGGKYQKSLPGTSRNPFHLTLDFYDYEAPPSEYIPGFLAWFTFQSLYPALFVFVSFSPSSFFFR